MKKIRDTIHNNIIIDDNDLEIIDSRDFQRLRYIKQLGTANFVYPGANHTRFEHSLGTYHVAKLITANTDINKDKKSVLKTAALLHDLGHGPLSHVFETLPGNPYDHEKRTRNIIMKGEISDIISDNGFTPKDITAVLEGKDEYSALISSTIDCDRMDYLARDAHYTGVKVAVDIDRLTSVMSIKNGKIIIKDIGLPVTEALLVTRFIMFSTVYLHHTTRAVDQMLSLSVNSFINKGILSWDDLWKMDDYEFMAFLKLNDATMYENIMNRNLLKPVCWITGGNTKWDIDKIYANRRVASLAEREIAELLDMNVEDIHIDIPPPPSKPTDIYIEYTEGSSDESEILPISEVSSLINSLDKSYAEHWEVRLYTWPEQRKNFENKIGINNFRLKDIINDIIYTDSYE